MNKDGEQIRPINIDSINSLESYLWHLGLLSVSVNTLISVQLKTETLGIFDEDEIELSKTVKYEARKLFVAINDLFKHCCDRTESEWPDLMKKIMDEAMKHTEKKVENPSKSKIPKKKKLVDSGKKSVFKKPKKKK